jgi:hypothetical protein
MIGGGSYLQPSGQLATWIDRIAFKRNDLKGRRQRDLRAEAILGHAQIEAKRRLQQKWAEFKVTTEDSDLCDCESCSLCHKYFYSGHSRCYCSLVFSTGPGPIGDSSPSASPVDAASAEIEEVEEDVCGMAKKFEEFFAEMDLVNKRKRDQIEDPTDLEDELSEPKRMRSSASA